MATVFVWIAQSGVMQGVIIGATFAFLTTILILNAVGRSLTTTINGWSSVRKVGQPGLGIMERAAGAKALPVVNVFEEAAYWTTTKDAAGRPLIGAQPCILRFPAGGLPPNDAFWSLTATDLVGYKVRSAKGHPSIDDRSGFSKNADGSIDIYLQHDTPIGHENNWVVTPAGKYKLMLRSYLPGAGILDGSYRVPAVERVS